MSGDEELNLEDKTNAQPTGESTTGKEQVNPDQQVDESNKIQLDPTVIASQEEPKTTEAPVESNEDRIYIKIGPKPLLRWLERWGSLVVSFLIFFSTSIYAIFAGLQWTSMRDSNNVNEKQFRRAHDLMKEQISIAQDQVNVLREQVVASERPWLSVSFGHLSVIESPADLPLFIKNLGKSPAFKMELVLGLTSGPNRLSEKEMSKPEATSIIIPAMMPQEQGELRWKVMIQQEHLDAIKKKNINTYRVFA